MSNHSTKQLQNDDKIVLEPYTYITQAGPEKRNVMARMCYSFNYWINCPEDKLLTTMKVVNMLFNSANLMDDFIDESYLRRGLPVSHLIFGLPRTLIAVTHMTYKALGKILNLEDPKLIECFIDLGLRTFRGQYTEMHYRNSSLCPSEEEWCGEGCEKTRGPFTFVVGMIQLCSNNTQDFSVLIDKVSIFCQILNDYENLRSDKYADLKSYCDDVTEGKFGFPTVHAVQSRRNDDQIINILKQRTSDIALKKHFVKLLEECGSFEYSRKMMEKLKNECFEEMKKFGKNPVMEKIFEDVLKNPDIEANFDCCG